jgi:hypothetical protein
MKLSKQFTATLRQAIAKKPGVQVSAVLLERGAG